ncbi:MAG: hypothetical protein IH984_04455 [Planctomycetes bacterium]|nr:hypothetical protein [Planctomycetota bacterium]
MRFVQTIVLSVALLLVTANVSAGDLALPNVISNHMILQRDQPVRIWGWAAANEIVRVAFGDQHKSAHADLSGDWSITLQAMSASNDPRTLTIEGENKTLCIQDVLVGEVWLCSGQSNMGMRVNNSQRADEFIAKATDSRLRMFIVPNTANHEPQEQVLGQWHVGSPETVGRFSAVAYHFGRNLIEQLDVPIGLINSSWGGSTVEAWVDRPTLETIEMAQPFLSAYDQSRDATKLAAEEFVGPQLIGDDWQTVELPTLIEDIGLNIDGLIWFRRTIDIPASWSNRDLLIKLGAIDDNDITFFAGVQIGATNNWKQLREYVIDGDLVEEGQAVVVIRVQDTGGAGGFSGSPGQMTIGPVDATELSISLAGQWHLRVISDKPSGPAQHRPANLYNAMIHGIRHYGLKGAIWYQGESNAINPRGEEYFTIFPAMIKNWRRAFDQPKLPFYFVQLPNFTNNETNSRWRYPVVRQAQLETLRTVEHTGMAITLDLGEANDIHPRNKHDVGERLARWALVDTYEVTGLVKSGPIFRNADFRGNGEVLLWFDLYGSSLNIIETESTLNGFELAGADGQFHAAIARIQDKHVVVNSKAVSQPLTIRYAWKNNPTEANLVNAENWPACPFIAHKQ